MTRGAVPITGLGCVSAAGPTLDACMASMFRGHRAPAPPRRFSTSHSVRYPVFEVPDFQAPAAILRTAALLLQAAGEALADAGLDRELLASLRVGACIGTTVGSAMNDEAFCRAFRTGADPSMGPMDRILASNPAAVLARELGLTGPCQTIVNACSSGTDAVGLGASWIEAGLCDLVLARKLPGVPFLSTKGFTGHTLGAAGAMEAAFTVACLEQGRIPASAGFATQDPDLGAAPVRENTKTRGTVALSQSLAFGGNNAVLALGLGARP
jgi:3-oxoacyl-(acyl-carrier-protein) synthase